MNPHPLTLHWNHGFDDQVDILTFQIEQARGSPYGRNSARRGRVVLAVPLVFIIMIGLMTGGWSPVLFGAAVYLILLLILLVIQRAVSGPYGRGSPARKQAETFAREYSDIPEGEHSLTVDADMLTWTWIDGRELHAYPMARIDRIQEAYGRVFLLQDHQIRGSLPVRAFRDAGEKQAFEQTIRGHLAAQDEQPQTQDP